MNKYFSVAFLMLILCDFISCKQAQSEFVFYKNGSTIPVIVLAEKPKGIESKTAQLFAQNFKQLTGKNIDIITESKSKNINDKILFFVGNTIESKQYKLQEKIKWDGFAIVQNDKHVSLIANQGMGLLYGANAFFERYAKVFYVDDNEKTNSSDKGIIITEDEWISNPDFMVRSVYFPQAKDYNYNLWNATQTIEEKWNIWGHNLNKIVDGNIVVNDQTIYAQYNGIRNDAQYCFSSNKLFEALKSGIIKKIAENPDATYFSISPNDNGIICECENCKKLNQPKSASNAVFMMVNKLAKQFPDLFFTSLAYSTTNKPPLNIKLEKNTAVLVSTIDYPKGIAIKESNKEKEFSTWISDWKNCSQNIFVWDYTVQYTNYFDFFPNIPALQKDLQYFKSIGITGIFEQGSEENYSLFGDYKSYVISKLLWNSEEDLEKLKYNFYENAYPTSADYIAEFVTSLEKNLQKSKAKLDIYGTVVQTMKNCLTQDAFEIFYYELIEKEKTAKGIEKIKLNKIITALDFDKLEIMRQEGFSENGYAIVDGIGDRKINNEILILLEKLQNASQSNGISVYSEINDSLSQYVQNWNQYIINKPYKSVIANSTIEIKTLVDENYLGNPAKSFTNGTVGFKDYNTNWLIFNGNLDVEIPITTNFPIKNISLSLLKDAKHYIFLPEKIDAFGYIDKKWEKLKDVSLTHSDSFEKNIQQVSLNLTENKTVYTKIKIIAYNITQLPPWAYHPTRKPTIACDEILMY